MSYDLDGVERGPRLSRGKVRDTYATNDPSLLWVEATDRISIFDVVLNEPVPGKGTVLTHMSEFWFTQVFPDVPNHFVGVKAPNVTIVRKALVIPVEWIVRGYLTGSGLKDYKASGSVCGLTLPEGLVEASFLGDPIFTPSTKEDRPGMHDANIDYREATLLVGNKARFEQGMRLVLDLYTRGADFARDRGIIIADTKFELGFIDRELVLIDEVLTPDSSRFWPLDTWEPGEESPSLDKQPARDWGNSVWVDDGRWNKKAPPPPCPDEVIRAVIPRYRQASIMLTGSDPLAV